MNTKFLSVILIACTFVAAGGYGLYRLGLARGHEAGGVSPTGSVAADSSAGAPSSALKAGDLDPSTGKKVLYWHDPMTPGPRFDKPGKSPFMDMELVPVYADDANDAGTVAISPQSQQNLGIRVAEVKTGPVGAVVEAVGSVAYNERDVAMVQARANGFVERLYVRAPLDPVRQGQPLAELYVPDWVAAQEEYLSAKRIALQSGAAGLDQLPLAAAQRMRLAGMNDEQIRAVEARGHVEPRLTITAPISGVIGELSVREGMTVTSGTPLFRINGLSRIWVNAEVPEALAGQVRPGTPAEARTPAVPGVIFKGKVSAILPEVNAATRTLKARVELANEKGQLVPGMFATVSFARPGAGDVLLVPSESIIQTGKRSIVMVAQGNGTFAPAVVETGIESGGQTEIRKGLHAGQNVVVSGQFLVDSEASLRATITRMSEMPQVSGAQSLPSPAATDAHGGHAP